MKTYRIITAFSAAMLITLTSISCSCGSKNDEVKNSKPINESVSENEGKTQLTIAMPWNDTTIEKAVKSFNKSNDKYEAVINNFKNAFYDKRGIYD